MHSRPLRVMRDNWERGLSELHVYLQKPVLRELLR
jgi:hypothetical protein